MFLAPSKSPPKGRLQVENTHNTLNLITIISANYGLPIHLGEG
jgi:hypothetical protein